MNIFDTVDRAQTLLEFFESSPVPMAQINRSGQFIFSNRLFSDLFGETRKKDFLIEELRKNTADASAGEFELSFPSELYSVRWKASSTEIGAHLVYILDRTEIQSASSESLKAVESLKQAQTEMEQFAYIASHDLQEPLRAVSSYLQLLDRRYSDRLDESAKEFIRFAVEGAKRMSELLKDLLAYSRAGRGELALAPMNSKEAIESVVQKLGPLIEQSKGKVEIEVLPEVFAQKDLFSLVFQHLLANALTFRRNESAPQIRVKALESDEGPIFVVEDNGIGIEPRFFERIFQIFQRLNERDAFPGSGVGLAIVKKIVQKQGGRIWVESQPNQGSRFFVQFPRVPKVTAAA